MRSFTHTRALAAALVMATTLAAPAAAQTTSYDLSSSSRLFWGCMGPCACPVIFTGQVKGGFTLLETGSDWLYRYYDVRDIACSYVVPNTAREVRITGRGTYVLGGEVALRQRMQLDLVSDASLVQHFDSGWVPPGATFPAIDIDLHVDMASCLDSVLHVIAEPTTGSVGPRAPGLRLAATPNPTRAGVEIVVSVPESGRATLEVIDVHGRVLATLADRVLPAGETPFAWDGRTRVGRDAGVGVFWVRARLGSHTATNRIVRFR